MGQTLVSDRIPTVTRIVLTSDGYQPSGEPIDLSRVSPPKAPTGAHKPRVENHAQAVVNRPQNEVHALKTLGDTSYLAWCLVKSMQQFIALVCKRWPEFEQAERRK